MTPSDAPAIWQYVRALIATRHHRRPVAHWFGAPSVRRYDAAKSDRLSWSWGGVTGSADSEIRMDLAALRARSRELAQNNDYAQRFLQMVQTHVVGPNGFTLQAQAADNNGAPDTMARRAIESAFWDWSQACDTTGGLDFPGLCRLAARTIAQDGECLIRRVRNRRWTYGYKLQIVDIDRLDILHNERLENGNVIRMGVELDSYGAPVAYHLLSRHPGEYLGSDRSAISRDRVPAEDIFHLFLRLRPEQTRGVPWMATPATRLNQLKGYEQAAVVAARVGAAKMGFFTNTSGSLEDLASDKDDAGRLMTDAEAGVFEQLPPGWDFKQFSPEYPVQGYADFVKSCLRGVSSGLGVSYNTLANDLEGVNYSSIRSGVLEERDNWMTLQAWLIGAFLRPVFLDWLDSALLKSGITMPNGSPLPAGKRFKFAAHAWQGRRWSWVDPEKDISASILAIRAGLSTPQIVAAQMGLDIEDVIDALQQANQMALAAGLPAYCAQQTQPIPPQN